METMILQYRLPAFSSHSLPCVAGINWYISQNALSIIDIYISEVHCRKTVSRSTEIPWGEEIIFLLLNAPCYHHWHPISKEDNLDGVQEEIQVKILENARNYMMFLVSVWAFGIFFKPIQMNYLQQKGLFPLSNLMLRRAGRSIVMVTTFFPRLNCLSRLCFSKAMVFHVYWLGFNLRPN